MRPKWDEMAGGHVLNFNGRVTISSVKNFQLCCTESVHLGTSKSVFGKYEDYKGESDGEGEDEEDSDDIGEHAAAAAAAAGFSPSEPSNFERRRKKLKVKEARHFRDTVVLQFGRVGSDKFTLDFGCESFSSLRIFLSPFF